MAGGSKSSSAKAKKIVIDNEVQDFLSQLQLRPYISDTSADLHSDRDIMNVAWHEIGDACKITGES